MVTAGSAVAVPPFTAIETVTVFPDAQPEEWLNCGVCEDCFKPAFNYVPTESTQYALALGNFEQPGAPQRFRFGVIGSSDNHSARAGTGYKEVRRLAMTDVLARGVARRRNGSLGDGQRIGIR